MDVKNGLDLMICCLYGLRIWIRFAPGVVPAFNWFLHILTKKDDGVIILTPVYYPFQDAIVNNGRQLVDCPLIRTENTYEIDYTDFENKIIAHNVKACIFCSPHNPVGRVWEDWELIKVLDICKKYGVYLLSDDILIILTAATKTFNLAAYQNAILVIPNEDLRKRYDEYLTRLRITGGNPFCYNYRYYDNRLEKNL